MHTKRNRLLPVTGLIVIGYFAASYVFPLYTIFRESFAFESSGYSFNTALFLKTIRFSFSQAILSTLITLIIGILGAYFFSTYKFRGKRIISAVLSIPFMLPTVVIAAGMNAMIGPNGWVNTLLKQLLGLPKPPIRVMNTAGIIIFTHVFYNISLVIRMVGNSWMLIDRNIISAAETLGTGPRKTFTKVIFPLLRPGILSAALLVFLFDFTSYGVVLLMGGPKYKTIEVEISYQALQVLDLKTAGILTLLQLLITLLIVICEQRIRNKTESFGKLKVYDENQRVAQRLPEKIGLWTYIISVLTLTLLPLLSLIFRSLWVPAADLGGKGSTSAFSLLYYKSLFSNMTASRFFIPPGRAIANSLGNALLCAAATVLIAGLICRLERQLPFVRRLRAFVLLPIGTSAVTLGLGYLIAWRKAITAWWITPLAHSIVALPFVLRTLQPAVDSLPASLEYSAALLGSKPKDVFLKIEFPILRRSVINSLIFAFTTSMGEFGATSFFSRPEKPTLPVAVYSFLSKPGGLNFGQAMAMSSILMLISLVSIFIMNYEPSAAEQGSGE